jgi:hypothetical protein
MAKKSSEDSPGFTTDYFGRCCICKEVLGECWDTCHKCHAYIFRVDPQPKQRKLIDMLLARGRGIPVRIGYGGSRGAAKSRGLRDAALVVISEVAQTLPGIVVYIVRTVWGDCEKNHLKEFELEHPQMMEWWSFASKEFAFPTAMGSPRLVFGFGDTFKDLRRFTRGPNIYLVLIDQSEGFPEDQLEELNTPNRWPAAGPGGAKTGYFFNPGGAGSEWHERVFFKRDFGERERPEDYAFLQGFGWDNFHGWFANQGILIGGEPLTKELFYTLPGEIPPCPMGRYDNAWLAEIPDNERFKIFVTQTDEGSKMWAKPDSIRMGELFGRFDQFANQFFSGINWKRVKLA